MSVAPRGKFNYREVRKEQLPKLKDKDDSIFDKVKQFGQLLEEHPPFPEKREYKDCGWAIGFLVTFFAFSALGVFGQSGLSTALLKYTGDYASGLLPALCGSVIAAVVGSLLLIHLGRICPSGLVITSVVVGPILLLAMTVVILMSGAPPSAVILWALVGVLSILFLIWFALVGRKFVPLSAELVRVTTVVLEENMGVLVMSVPFSLLAVLWPILWTVSAFELHLLFNPVATTTASLYDHEESPHKANSTGMYISLFVLYWVMQVFYGVVHTTFCGVFGRWYYKADAERPVLHAICVSLTTSLGSIALLGFLVAVVKTLSAMANQKSKESGGNICVAIVMCIIACILASIADMLEYFNSWALVLCANRGVGALDAVKMTWALATLANLSYITNNLIVNSIVGMGSLICGVIGAVTAGLIAGFDVAPILVGLFVGFTVGRFNLGVFDSGSKTIIYGWCQDAERIRAVDVSLESDLSSAVQLGYAKDMGY